MAKRVVLGNDGTDYGLQISKSGDDVIDDTINTRDLLFTTVDNYRSGIIASDTDVTAMTTSGVSLPTTADANSNNYIPAYQIIEKGVKSPVLFFLDDRTSSGIGFDFEATMQSGLPTSGGGGLFELSLGGSGTTANLVKAAFIDIVEGESIVNHGISSFDYFGTNNYPFLENTRTRGSSDGDVNILMLRIPCQYGKMTNDATLFGTSVLTGAASGGGGSGGSGSVSAPADPTVTRTARNTTNDTVSVSSSSGSGNSGTITFAQTTSNSTPSSGFSSTTSYTQARGTTRYYWAKQGGLVSGSTQYDAPSVDSTPDSFNITDKSNLEPSTLTESDAVTITGLVDAATVTISGSSAQFSINGGSYGTSGTITNNQTLKIRMTSNSNFGGFVETTVTVGGVTDTIRFTTRTANVTAPTSVTATQITNTSGSSQTVDVTASGGTGTAQVSNDGSNYYSNGTNFSHSRNSTVTYYARNTNEGSNSSAITTSKFVPPVVTLSGISDLSFSSSAFDNTYNVDTQRAGGNYNTHSSHWGTTTVSISDNGSWLTTQVTNTSTGTFRLAAAANTGVARSATVTYTTSTSFGASHTMTFIVTQAVAPDTTPDDIVFTAQTVASGVTANASDQITGINTSITVSYSGSATGSFAVSSSSSTPSSGFSQSSKSISNNQFIHIRDTAPSTGGTSVSAIVTAGGKTGTFTVIAATDGTPDAFSFTGVTGASTLSQHTDSVTITGINTSVTASISMGTDTGGGFRVNNSGSYTQTSKTVSNNDVVTVLVVTGIDSFTLYQATLTVGGVSDTFQVSTGSSGGGGGEP